ncbi:hypothetical protein [Pusillimonas sp.]|uniref:hypothetical protein n=1 Tax=Pusillimonas sp. TaxID=3040095 RepID=UPI0037C6317C
MTWALAAQMVLGFGTSWYQSYIQKAQFDAQNIINQANADASNLVNRANADAANQVRTANNTFAAAQAALQNSQRSIANREKLSAFGDQWTALETNQNRILDAMTRGKLSAQLKAAANLGALRAESAARGVGGSSAAIMRSVASLAAGHQETQLRDNEKYVTYDALLQKAGMLRASVNSLDLGQNLASMDYGTNVAPLVQAPLNPGDFISPTRTALLSTLVQNSGDLVSLAGSWGSKNALQGINTSGAIGGSLGSSSNFSATTQYFNMA